MPDDTRAMTVAEPVSVAVQHHSGGDMLTNRDAFEHGWRVAKLFASSQLIPSHLRDKPADCFIALHMARELRENPVVVLQNIYIVSGKAGWSATYMIGRANRSGVFKGRITWVSEGAGDKLVVTARATLADTGEVIQAEASMAMAKAEGWTKNSKYTSMPEHMLRWRSATMLIRLYAPEVMLGIPTSDELEDMGASGRVVDVGSTEEPIERDAFEQAASGAALEYDPQTGEISPPNAAAPVDGPDSVVGASAKEPQERQQRTRTAADDAFFAGEDNEIRVPTGAGGKPDWRAWGAAMLDRISVATKAEAATLDEQNYGHKQDCLGAAGVSPAIVSQIDAAFAAAEKRHG